MRRSTHPIEPSPCDAPAPLRFGTGALRKAKVASKQLPDAEDPPHEEAQAHTFKFSAPNGSPGLSPPSKRQCSDPDPRPPSLPDMDGLRLNALTLPCPPSPSSAKQPPFQLASAFSKVSTAERSRTSWSSLGESGERPSPADTREPEVPGEESKTPSTEIDRHFGPESFRTEAARWIEAHEEDEESKEGDDEAMSNWAEPALYRIPANFLHGQP